MFPPRLSAILLLLFPLLLSTAYRQNDSNPLELGQPLERELGAPHLYHFTLAAGECARVELQAASARLNLALLSEKNELIAAISEADAPGSKRLDIVAALQASEAARARSLIQLISQQRQLSLDAC